MNDELEAYLSSLHCMILMFLYWWCYFCILLCREKCEDTKGVARSRKSRMDRRTVDKQCNDQIKTKTKGKNDLRKHYTEKKKELNNTNINKNQGWIRVPWKGKQFLLHYLLFLFNNDILSLFTNVVQHIGIHIYNKYFIRSWYNTNTINGYSTKNKHTNQSSAYKYNK